MGEGDRDRIERFFGYELIGVAICRGIMEVVVVEIVGREDVEAADVMKGKLIFPLLRAM